MAARLVPRVRLPSSVTVNSLGSWSLVGFHSLPPTPRTSYLEGFPVVTWPRPVQDVGFSLSWGGGGLWTAQVAWCFSRRGNQNSAAHLEWSRALVFWLGGNILISTFRGRYRWPRARDNEARAVTCPRPGTQWGLATQLLGTHAGLDVRCRVGSGPRPAGWGWVSSLSGCLSDVGQLGACTGSQAGLTGREESLEGRAEAFGALPPRRKETIGVWGSESCTRGSLLFSPLVGTSPGSGLAAHGTAYTWNPGQARVNVLLHCLRGSCSQA